MFRFLDDWSECLRTLWVHLRLMVLHQVVLHCAIAIVVVVLDALLEVGIHTC